MAAGAYPWSAGFRSLGEELNYRVEDVEGDVPRALRGTLFRNGSGAKVSRPLVVSRTSAPPTLAP